MDNVIQLRKEKVKELEERKADLQVELDLGKETIELLDDDRYKAIIANGFMGKEVDRVVEILTTPMNMKRDANQNLIGRLEAVRYLREYLKTLIQNAETADSIIRDIEEEIVFINSGGLDDSLVEDATIDVEAEEE